MHNKCKSLPLPTGHTSIAASVVRGYFIKNKGTFVLNFNISQISLYFLYIFIKINYIFNYFIEMTKTTAYLRVSTLDQDVEKNKADILRLANDRKLGHVTFIEDKVSGKVRWRNRKIADILDEMVKGDNLIVSEMSRLGRSVLECMEILSLALDRGINIYAVKGDWKLDNSLQSKVMAMAFSLAADIEGDFISQRTKEGLRARKAKGLPLGRPKGPGKSKLDPYKEEIFALLANGSTKTFIAKRYGTTNANLWHWLKNHRY